MQFKWIGRGSPTPHSFGYTHWNMKFSQPRLKRMESYSELNIHRYISCCSCVGSDTIQAYQHISPLIYDAHTRIHIYINKYILPHYVLKPRKVTLCHGWQQLVPIAEKLKMSSCCNATGWAGLPLAMAGLLLCCKSTQPPTACLLDRAHYSRQALHCAASTAQPTLLPQGTRSRY